MLEEKTRAGYTNLYAIPYSYCDGAILFFIVPSAKHRYMQPQVKVSSETLNYISILLNIKQGNI